MALSKVNPNFVNQLGRRNLIINGAMQVAQRGTSSTLAAGYSTVDRFKHNNGSIGSLTTTQESTNSPSGDFKYSMKVASTNTASIASNSDGWIRYIIETKDIENLVLTDSNKTITVSFYVKCSNTGQSSIGVTSGNFSSGRYVHPFTITAADTWQKVSFTMPGNSLLSNVNGDFGLRLYWDIGAGTTYQTSSTNSWGSGGTYASSGNLQITGVDGRYLQITGVQLEVGDTATPFEHRSYAEELAACQRYFFNPNYNLGGSRNDYACNYSVSTGNNGWVTWIVPFHVPMRASSTFSHSLTNAKFNSAAAPANGADTWSFYVQNQGYVGRAGNGNMSTLSGGGKYQGVVGTYYVSPTGTTCSHIMIGNGSTFQFNAEID